MVDSFNDDNIWLENLFHRIRHLIDNFEIIPDKNFNDDREIDTSSAKESDLIKELIKDSKEYCNFDAEFSKMHRIKGHVYPGTSKKFLFKLRTLIPIIFKRFITSEELDNIKIFPENFIEELKKKPYEHDVLEKLIHIRPEVFCDLIYEILNNYLSIVNYYGRFEDYESDDLTLKHYHSFHKNSPTNKKLYLGLEKLLRSLKKPNLTDFYFEFEKLLINEALNPIFIKTSYDFSMPRNFGRFYKDKKTLDQALGDAGYLNDFMGEDSITSQTNELVSMILNYETRNESSKFRKFHSEEMNFVRKVTERVFEHYLDEVIEEIFKKGRIYEKDKKLYEEMQNH